jgi:RNA polymerase sigma factor (sigma-70 family)
VNPSDQELIEQLLSGSQLQREKGWEYVYRMYYPVIRDMVMKNNGSVQDAVDIFQDGLLVLNRNLNNGTFRNEATLNTYIFSICKNLWLKEYNRKQRQSLVEQELIVETRQHFDYIVNVEVVGRLMNELEEDCRKILIEYYFNNRSMAELKVMFNVSSIQAAKNKKWRCLKYLIRLFKAKGVSPVWD